jgi:hypothetical protein
MMSAEVTNDLVMIISRKSFLNTIFLQHLENEKLSMIVSSLPNLQKCKRMVLCTMKDNDGEMKDRVIGCLLFCVKRSYDNFDNNIFSFVMVEGIAYNNTEFVNVDNVMVSYLCRQCLENKQLEPLSIRKMLIVDETNKGKYRSIHLSSHHHCCNTIKRKNHHEIHFEATSVVTPFNSKLLKEEVDDVVVDEGISNPPPSPLLLKNEEEDIVNENKNKNNETSIETKSVATPFDSKLLKEGVDDDVVDEGISNPPPSPLLLKKEEDNVNENKNKNNETSIETKFVATPFGSGVLGEGVDDDVVDDGISSNPDKYSILEKDKDSKKSTPPFPTKTNRITRKYLFRQLLSKNRKQTRKHPPNKMNYLT